MKRVLFTFLLIILGYSAFAQSGIRRISFRTIDRDSISLSLNDEYYLIEDSCAQIIRNCRFNFTTKKFHGKFSDVSKANPSLIVATGTYSDDGLKNGLFTSWYLNGKLQAKGYFKNNQYDGKWEMYFDTGKPELTFQVTDGKFNIADAWDADGRKTVDNGNGIYIDEVAGGMYWKGKLLNGSPDGKWNLTRKDDISNTPLSTEHFKKGEFKDGATGELEYSNGSHIVLVNPAKLPMVNAEKMYISSVPCNGTKRKHIVGAQYEDGLKVFSSYIGDAVTPFLSRTNLRGLNTTINITGEVAENGAIENLKNEGAKTDLNLGLIDCLRHLPPLHPATIDGNPTRQKFVITFKISDNIYEFTYRFLSVEIPE